MASTLALKVAQRYARQLNDAEFTKLMKWLGPKAFKAHQKFPNGQRYFDLRTRVFRYNIDPTDYLNYNIEQAKAMMAEGSQLRDVVNPEAYRAMKGVLETLRRRRIKFKMINVSWAAGGSYIEATMPKPEAQPMPEPGKVDPRTWMG